MKVEAGIFTQQRQLLQVGRAAQRTGSSALSTFKVGETGRYNTCPNFDAPYPMPYALCQNFQVVRSLTVFANGGAIRF
ncbi:hypothetical protein NIES2107_01080 [Nostoc carneum NIES-2107]|nr:hypothetical protein NIES2107_01080 [Nostoc carneum NIES-2107]